MIECKIRHKKIKKKHKVGVWLLIIFILIALTFLYIFLVVNPIVVESSEAKIKSLTQRTLSNSVMTVISENTLFDDLVQYKYDQNNKISSISVQSLSANILARQITSLAQTQLDNVAKAGVDIHLGAFTGITLLASVGPLLKLNLQPIGTVTAKFKSEFLSAGINQTLHKIWISVDSSVFVVLPGYNPKIDANTEVLLTETLIVGEIPSTYLQSSYLDEMLNLVPSAG